MSDPVREDATQGQPAPTRSYSVTVDVRCSTTIDVEAVSKEDAVRVAREQFDAGWYDIDDGDEADWDTASARAGS